MRLWTIRALLGGDKDARRLWWLTRRAPLQAAHRSTLLPLCDRLTWTSEERTVLQTLFRLYRPTEN